MKRGISTTARRIAWVCAASLWTGASALRAQSVGPETTDRAIIKTQSLLPSRNRASMHPGDPLKLVGLEQGDQDRRASTPVLAQSDRAVAVVNADENYSRTLAMYEQGASFHQSVASQSQPWSSFSDNAPGGERYSAPDDEARDQGPRPTANVERRAGVGVWPWAFAACAVGLLAVRRLARSGRELHPVAVHARRI